jgi:hypothetical protein
MHPVLDRLPELIDKVAGILELLIFRLMLLALAGPGAYALLCNHVL